MRFQFNPGDESVDSEYALLNDDGSETSISIQDCRSYGGGYAVNRYGSEGDEFFVMCVGEAKTLAKAKAIALAKAAN